MLCRLTNPNLPGWLDAPVTSTPRGSNSASELLVRRRRVRASLGVRPSAAPSSTSASTATGVPSAPTISGLTSMLRDVGPGDGDGAEADEHGDQLLAVDGRLAAERAEQLLRRERVDHLVGVEPR